MAAVWIGGRYRLDGLLGGSSMAEVWCADDAELERKVALKLLAPDADRARFDLEARAAAALADPNITQLYDYGEADGRPFMVLEFCPGGTLEEQLEPGRPLDDERTRTIAREVASGLGHAHARGLVHRDLKPANILFDAEGRAKIADFGIARLATAGTLTEAGTVLGTAAYISPEQAAGRPATPASDIYSFGVILYRLLTGELPFDAEDPLALIALHRDAAPPALTTVRRDAPPALAALATAALAKDASARPRNGEELLATLARTDEATPAGLAETEIIAPLPRRGPRRRLALLAALLAVLAAAGAALGFAVTRRGSPGPSLSSTSTPLAARQTSSRQRTATTRPVAAVTPVASLKTAATRTAATTTTDTETHRHEHRRTPVPATIPTVPTDAFDTTTADVTDTTDTTDTTTLDTTAATTTGP